MARKRTEQERFWQGAFGDQYTVRNQGPEMVAANIALFTSILKRTHGIGSVLELGANLGSNLLALQQLLVDCRFTGVEINAKAAELLGDIEGVRVLQQSALDLAADERHDLVFCKGVLIHMDPTSLDRMYDVMAGASRRYVLIAEYYNPTPVEVAYRGRKDRLFKRDFAGEFRARHAQFELLDYGFVYHGDEHFPQDDLTWFLLSNKGG